MGEQLMSVTSRTHEELEEYRREAEAYLRLPSDERLRVMARIFAEGWAKINASPDREAILRRMDEEEEEWRRIQQRLFAEFEASIDVPVIIDHSPMA
jgi:hypothetical protein